MRPSDRLQSLGRSAWRRDNGVAEPWARPPRVLSGDQSGETPAVVAQASTLNSLTMPAMKCGAPVPSVNSPSAVIVVPVGTKHATT
jgi:hypothetical protein